MASKLLARILVRKCLQVALLAALLSQPAQAGKLPDLVIPEGVGINIHFTRGNEKDLDLIAAAGIRVVRTDLKWDETERYKGVYDWSAYDELAANLAKRGIRPLFILDYSNPLYEETKHKLWLNIWSYYEVMSPRSPTSIAAFARWAVAAEQHFRKYDVIWEIWNEPNIKFWKPAPAVAEYTRLAMATCQAIHAANPNATVIGPASSGIPWDFLEYLFKAGALSCLDAVSVHPYRNSIPESAGGDYIRLRKLVDQYTPANHKEKIPILSGEWGYATVLLGRPQIEQANFVVRMQLFNMLYGIPLSVWYDWKNDGTDRRKHEHNFGVVQTDLAPKSSYVALKTLTTQLSGFKLVMRLNLGKSDDYALLFMNAAGQGKIVAWTIGRPHKTRIAGPPAPRPTKMTLTTWEGFKSDFQLDGAWIPVSLSQSPIYISP
ncbi:MAG: cellulase family glycosylhydrolase [Pseudomonadota bacterium]